MGIRDRIVHAWNAFRKQEEEPIYASYGGGIAYADRPDRVRLRTTNERSIIASIFTRMSIDVASVDIRHVRLDDQDRFKEVVKSGLNECLTVEANLDQAARHFRQDVVMSLFDRGVIAIVPVETNLDPTYTDGYDITQLRVGEIIDWFPDTVRVRVYDQRTGQKKDIPMPKKAVAIIENPLYTVMNEHNSTLQRLIRKLNLLDVVDEQSSSGRLDIIVQLPYAIKSETRRKQARDRRDEMEYQLKDSKYGIAYADATEKITQLNRPAENNLLKQVEFLTAMLYSQLGLTVEVMNGTADEKAMLNYHNRTIEPILGAIAEAMRRAFLSKTARTKKQTVLYFRDPFRLVPMEVIAEIADKFTRNEIASSNDMRTAIGWRPSPDPKADELRNSNMPDPNAAPKPEPQTPSTKKLGGDSQNGS